MYGKIKEYLQRELADIKAAGLYKTERVIASPQRAEIEVAGRSVLNFCANNYLGLSDDERLIEAAARIFTRSWNVRSPIISARRTRFSTPPASTPTEAFSSRSSRSRTPSSRMR